MVSPQSESTRLPLQQLPARLDLIWRAASTREALIHQRTRRHRAGNASPYTQNLQNFDQVFWTIKKKEIVLDEVDQSERYSESQIQNGPIWLLLYRLVTDPGSAKLTACRLRLLYPQWMLIGQLSGETLQTLISELLQAPGVSKAAGFTLTRSLPVPPSSSELCNKLHLTRLAIFFFHFLLMRVHFTK